MSGLPEILTHSFPPFRLSFLHERMKDGSPSPRWSRG
jgi:hypothetical protein